VRKIPFIYISLIDVGYRDQFVMVVRAVNAWAAAPQPRPPQPTNPILIAFVTDWAEIIAGN
jgi:hypothetical protein